MSLKQLRKFSSECPWLQSLFEEKCPLFLTWWTYFKSCVKHEQKQKNKKYTFTLQSTNEVYNAKKFINYCRKYHDIISLPLHIKPSLFHH